MYQVIARKYRPQTFQDVVNQDHVKQTLTNALSQERVAHGYIFSGQRGTGKTTMARILAKALNCEKGPSPQPCLQCSSCTEIAAGQSLDLIEIDAASNRRIDDIRELRENVRYRPVRDRYKVFIIDEAHQITTDAFNALLKTLEEPPEWVVFVLCTTEPHEIPATIVSRCQGFPFRAVELEQVVERMRWICDQEGIEADADALVSMALAGDGSIRDSLSTLDQAIACFGNRLEAASVRDLLGAIPSEITDRIVQVLRDQDAAGMLEIVDRVLGEGRHVQHFCGELTRYFRNLLVMKAAGPDTRLVTAGPDERSRLEACLEYFSQEDLTRYVQLLLSLYRDLQHATQPRFRLEVGLLKLVYAGHLQPLEKVLAEWDGGAGDEPRAGGPGLASGAKTRRAAGNAAGARDLGRAAQRPRDSSSGTEDRPAKAAAGPGDASPAAREPAPQAGGRKPAESAGSGEDLKVKLVDALRRAGDDHLADALEHGRLDRVENQIEIRALADYQIVLEIGLDSVRQALGQIAGGDVRIRLGSHLEGREAPRQVLAAAAGAGGSGVDSKLPPVSVSGNDTVADSDAARRALADPEVRKFQELFEGRVREVRDLRGYSS